MLPNQRSQIREFLPLPAIKTLPNLAANAIGSEIFGFFDAEPACIMDTYKLHGQPETSYAAAA
jgi:hypothetical protein